MGKTDFGLVLKSDHVLKDGSHFIENMVWLMRLIGPRLTDRNYVPAGHQNAQQPRLRNYSIITGLGDPQRSSIDSRTHTRFMEL